MTSLYKPLFHSQGEPKVSLVAHCPHCGLVTEYPFLVEWLFGYRYDGTKVQSRCRSCRSRLCKLQSPCATCDEEAISFRARRLLNAKFDLKSVADELGMSPTNKGRIGRVIELLMGMTGKDNRSDPDWHGVEVKGVRLRSETLSGGHRLAADKIFVCSSTQDPIAKLERVMYVFFDGETGLLVDILSMSLTPTLRQRLQADVAKAGPKSASDLLFLNTKGSGRAWYLHEDFFLRCNEEG